MYVAAHQKEAKHDGARGKPFCLTLVSVREIKTKRRGEMDTQVCRAVATMGLGGVTPDQGKYCCSETRRFRPWRSFSSGNFANLSTNKGLYAHFVGIFILDTPLNRTSSDGHECADRNVKDNSSLG